MTHYLVIEELLGNEPDFDRWIEHEDDCPTELRYYNEIDGNHYHRYTCGIGYWTEIMDLWT